MKLNSVIQKALPGDENGFILVVSMLILAALSIIGLAGTNTTSLELQIAGNERRVRRLFYEAESATFAVAQKIEKNEIDKLTKIEIDKIPLYEETDRGTRTRNEKKKELKKACADLKVKDWSSTTALASVYPALSQQQLQQALTDVSDLLSTPSVLVLDMGIADGSSLSMSDETNVHEYYLLGQAASGNAEEKIGIGYKKRQ